jgi:enoyl-CoA hydratase/carnithine racemase
MADQLKLDRDRRITIATLNRPERHNALTVSLANQLGEAVRDFEQDKEQRVLIITGAGTKAFCSGADLSETRDRAEGEIALPMTPEQDISGIAACTKPVIAAINGFAIGGGVEIALCCDVRLSAENAWFAFPEVERGFIAGIAAVTLPRLMPFGAVMDLMLTGERLSAPDAFRLGLVQQVTPAGDLMAEAMRRAERISNYSRAALVGTKKILRYWRDMALQEQHRYYQSVVQNVFHSRDYMEGLTAFKEKRKPEY